MTRIVAGFAGSLTLTVPPNGTRPTSDRVREAIFSALHARDLLDGARVVDLYAGSGALGLEAASRGAQAVTLVERSQSAIRHTRKNVALVLKNAPKGSALTVDVSTSAVQGFLTNSTATWDIAFLDPPYDLSNAELLLALEALAPRLAEDGVVVLERSTRTSAPELPATLTLDRQTKYGDTALYWLSVRSR